MDRLNHVKIVTPDPAAVDTFLREVVDIPEGWQLGPLPEGDASAGVASPARDADGNFTSESVMTFRDPSPAAEFGGFITGSTDSRQFQITTGSAPKIWGIAIGTRHLERAHERCTERGIPCTEIRLTPWGESGTINFFFAEVGGIVFEVMRAGSA
ncbi:MAG: hypothetical protein QOF40_2205 [Actinomycetota bacterium]|nr:hypothetical protein [Actinomycetota bacterium]